MAVTVLADFHLHVDADRDGKVDEDRSGLDTWEWGKGKKGAILLCNNDDDQGASASDNSDTDVNAGNDKDELAPLVIKRAAGIDPPADWEASLEVAIGDEAHVRIFDSRAAGGKEIVGPTKGRSYTFPDLKFKQKELGMEAVDYADLVFDGEVVVTFTVKKGGEVSHQEKAKFRVAPWMMPNHLDKAEKVYVVDAGTDNAPFRAELSTMVSAAGCSLVQHSSPDVWMQDCMEFGFASLPNSGFRSVVRAPRPRPLSSYPETLRTADLGYYPDGALPVDAPTFNSMGNLECSPPASKGGKKYPWGRIYYGPGGLGEKIDTHLEEFLKAQVVQEPFTLDTIWLYVGHVDEIVTFVPAPSGKRFKVLLASPKCAYKILDDNKATHGSDKLLVGRSFPTHGSAEATIKDFLDTGILGLDPAALRTFNNDCQNRIDGVRATLTTELDLVASDFIDIPVLYAELTAPGFADALTAGMVNMLVINRHCGIPKPYGPVVGTKDLFEEDVKTKLKASGLTPHFLDDWKQYHVELGEVHCGTNTLRTPAKAKWWEFQPWGATGGWRLCGWPGRPRGRTRQGMGARGRARVKSRR